VTAFGAIVAMILKRSLNRDFTNIELTNTRRREIRQQRAAARREGNSEEEIAGLTGVAAGQIDAADVSWKRLSGDVMRTPRYPMILCFFMGTGT